MGKTRSYCGSKCHNARACITYNKSTSVGPGFRLFGVQVDTSAAALSTLKKSCSVGCLSPSTPRNSSKFLTRSLSDGLVGHLQNRKKGVSWTEEEHRKFLAGLEKLGKGDWRGISKHFIPSRTPTQVASHAQKYFLRLNKLNKKRDSPTQLNLGTELIEKRDTNDLSNMQDIKAYISTTLWQKNRNHYWSKTNRGRPSYSQSPMSNLSLASWLYNSNGLRTYPNLKFHSRPTTVEAEPNLELTLAVPTLRESTIRCLGA